MKARKQTLKDWQKLPEGFRIPVPKPSKVMKDKTIYDRKIKLPKSEI